jgi:NAD(P)H-hydrate epimerase
VDIPSGLAADTGLPLGQAVCATATVTFCLPKRGLFVGEGLKYAGQVDVVDIGIPQEEMEKVKVPLSVIDPQMFVRKLPKRRPNAHKGTFGHVVIFAGSRGHLGAGYLACLAALRAGCGVATYCIPEKAFVRFDARYPEVMCDPIPDAGSASFHPSGLDQALAIARGKSAVAIGPAIGASPATREFVNGLVKRIDVPLVIDADGLNVLDLASIRRRRSFTILTPHPGEMSRLMSATSSAVQADRLGFASKLAQASGAIVILKGQGTVVAAPDGTAFINPTGNAGMATAGMGDALTGMVASFLAQGMDPRDASVAAVYIHGLAGDMAAAEHTERALITSDVIRCLGKAIKEIEA